MSAIDTSKKQQIISELVRYRGAALRPTVASAAEAFKVTESWVYRIVDAEGLQDCISTADQEYLTSWVDSDEAAELEAQDFPRMIRTNVLGRDNEYAHTSSHAGSGPAHYWEFQLDEDTFIKVSVDVNGVGFKSTYAGEVTEKTSRNWQYILIEMAKAGIEGSGGGWVFGNHQVTRFDKWQEAGMFEYDSDSDGEGGTIRYESALKGRGVTAGMASLMDLETSDYRVRRRNFQEDANGREYGPVEDNAFEFFVRVGHYRDKGDLSYAGTERETLAGYITWHIYAGELRFNIGFDDIEHERAGINTWFSINDVYDFMDPDDPQK